MEDIYEALFGLCQTFTLPGLWRSIPCDPSFIFLPKDNKAILLELQRDFANADLIKSGIATTDAANALVWNPNLVVEGSPIWVIRSKPNEKPIGLIAQMSVLGHATWALCWAFQNHRQNELIAASGNQVVVAYSMADLAILQSIGIAAVPGGKWANLTKGQLYYLYQKVRSNSQRSQQNTYGASADTELLSLILANWSLAAFDITDIESATTSWSHLMKLNRHLKLSFEDFGIWKPTKKHLEQLAYRLKYQNVDHVCDGLLNVMEQDSSTIEQASFPKPSPAQTISEAYRAWQKAERNSMNPNGSQKAFEQLCEMHDRQRIDPLVEEAMQASDPLERNAELALAEVSRLLQPIVLLLTEKIRRSIGEKGTRVGSVVSKEEMASVLAQTDRLIALTKGVQEWRQNKPTKKALSLKPSAVRSKPSASTPKNSPH